MAKPNLGVTITNFREPAKLAREGSRGTLMKNLAPERFLLVLSVAHFMGWNFIETASPRLGFAIAWG